MFAESCFVLVRADDVYRRIEDIGVGDYVFDPLAQTYCRIVDAVSRVVSFGSIDNVSQDPLYPVKLDVNAFGAERIGRSVLVSPSQGVLLRREVAFEREQPSLEYVTARELLKTSSCATQPKLNSVRYFALFTQHEQTLNISGFLMPTFFVSGYRSDRGREGNSSNFDAARR